MNLHQYLALAMAIFFAGNSAAARPKVLGVVVEAERAHVNTGEVSVGATVYDGDYFSTETGGIVRVRGEAAILDLAEESVMIVRSGAIGSPGTEAELGKGTLVFSTEGAAALEIVAGEARVRPLSVARTVAQVSVTGPKELQIYVRRGALQFSYRGETRTIAEGESYRVILDPPDDISQKKENVKAGRQRKAFLFLAIGGGSAGAAAVAYEKHHHRRVESPDRP
jgi:hypothetical protein